MAQLPLGVTPSAQVCSHGPAHSWFGHEQIWPCTLLPAPLSLPFVAHEVTLSFLAHVGSAGCTELPVPTFFGPVDLLPSCMLASPVARHQLVHRFLGDVDFWPWRLVALPVALHESVHRCLGQVDFWRWRMLPMALVTSNTLPWWGHPVFWLPLRVCILPAFGHWASFLFGGDLPPFGEGRSGPG